MSNHTHITKYNLGGPGPLEVDVLEYDYETEAVSRRTLSAGDRVDDVGEDFELLGLAEDYHSPSTVWGVYEHIHSDAWGVVRLGELDDLGMAADLHGEEWA